MQEIQKILNIELWYLMRNEWKNDKKFFKEFFWNIMSLRTTIMSKLWFWKYKYPKKMSEKIKHFFEKDSFKDFPLKVEKRCFSMLWKINKNDYIVFDEVDIAKQYSKKLEHLAKVRDWSTWNIVSWYMYHWVSINWIPVILEYEDLINKFKAEYFWKLVKKVETYVKWKGTYVFDAWYDIASYIQFLNDNVNKWIIRAKKDRIYFDIKTNKYLKLKEFTDWIHKVKIKWVKEAAYLHIKSNSKFPEPMRIISNSRKTDTEEYKQRREIETIFKTMKQEFQLEKLQTSSLIVFKNFVATIQLAMALTKKIYKENNSFEKNQRFILSPKFKSRFRNYSQSIWLTMNSNSIVKFISYCLQKLYKLPKKKIKNANNKNSWVSSQLSLFSGIDFVKSG